MPKTMIINKIIRFVKKRIKRLLNYIRISIKTLSAKKYIGDPTDADLLFIENKLKQFGVEIDEVYVDLDDYNKFKLFAHFPEDYHGGISSDVYEEKILEHYIAWKFLGDGNFQTPYIDIAAASSPWVKILNEKGYNDVFAIDLYVHDSYKNLPFYQKQDATKTLFDDNSISGASLQCAFENFNEDNDIKLIVELGRILRKGGKAVIVPLYVHTHACFWQSPEYYGVVDGENDEVGYVRKDIGYVSYAKFYSAENLLTRIFKTANDNGLNVELSVLRNKGSIDSHIYLHFILVLEKK